MFKHYGAVATKHIFSIHVSTVSLPNMEDNFEGGEALCVSYERGGKRKTLQYSREKTILMDKDDNIFVEFSEDFKTDATLYREPKTGKFQEKMCMLSVLQRKKGSSGFKRGGNSKDCFKTIGVANVPLHEVADGQMHELSLPLTWCVSELAVINVTISANERDNASETSSMQDSDSVADDASVASASEYSAASTSAASMSSGLKLFPTRSSHRPPAAAAPQPAGIPPTISEMDGDGDDGKWDAHTQRLTPSSLKMYSSQQPTLSSPVPMSIMGVSGGAGGGGGGASRLLEMQQKIEQLEAAVLASEEIVQFERQRSKDALQRAGQAERALSKMREQEQQRGGAQQSAAAQHLAEEVQQLQQELQKLSGAAGKSDHETRRLQQLQTSLSAELDELSAEKARLESALTVAREENQILLNELINAKMSVGNLSTELDEANRQLRMLKAANGGGGATGTAAAAGRVRAPPPPNNIFANTAADNPIASSRPPTSAGQVRRGSGGPVVQNPFSTSQSQSQSAPSSSAAASPSAGLLMRGFGSSTSSSTSTPGYVKPAPTPPVKNPFATTAAAGPPQQQQQMRAQSGQGSTIQQQQQQQHMQHQQYLQQQRQQMQMQQRR